MRSRRGGTALSGVLAIDKPWGMTSHDVVSAVRAATGERRVGHAGTLDPAATGLLLVLLGPATRLERYLVGHTKRYAATIAFGRATDTEDAQGLVTETLPVPSEALAEPFARRVLAGFLGVRDQLPPAYSAIKQGGVTAYRRARAGETVVLQPRSIEVFAAEITGINQEQATWDVLFEVSKGTYIRSLARDIGRAAGTVAHLAALRRLRVGDLDVAAATSLPEVEAAAECGTIEALMCDPVGLLGMPVVALDPEAIRDGRPVSAEGLDLAEGQAVAIASDKLYAVYRRRQDRLVPETVFATGVTR